MAGAKEIGPPMQESQLIWDRKHFSMKKVMTIPRSPRQYQALTCAILASVITCYSADKHAAGRTMMDNMDDWRVEHYCGNPRSRGFLQGPINESAVNGSMAFDSKGNAYLSAGTSIRMITTDGKAVLIAGTPGLQGSTDGPGWKSTFAAAGNIVSASDDTFYVSDRVNFNIRKLERKADGTWHISTVAGTAGKTGHKDGTGNQALFSAPFNGLVYTDGILYAMDANWLRKIENGIVTTLNAGTGYVNGPLKDARFKRAMGGGGCLTTNGKGNLYVADRWNQAIRKVDLRKKEVTTYAGVLPGKKWGGPHDGSAFEARFHPGGGPCGNTFNKKHSFLLVQAADEGGRIRIIKDGWVKTFFAPNKRKKGKISIGPLSKVTLDGGVCGIDPAGNIYISKGGRIRVIRYSRKKK